MRLKTKRVKAITGEGRGTRCTAGVGGGVEGPGAKLLA